MTLPGVPLSIPGNPSPRQGAVVPIQRFQRQPLATDVKYPIGFQVIIGENPSTGTQGDLWWLSSFDGSGQAVWKQFLSGASSPGIDSITTDDGSPEVEPDVNGNVNILGGTGCATAGQGPGNTVTINVTGMGLDWSVIQSATQTISVGHGYFADRSGGVTFTLPVTAAVGDTFIITNINAGGFIVAQNSGQTIHQGTNSSTTGVGGSANSTAIGDSLILTCAVANTQFWATFPPQGNITLV